MLEYYSNQFNSYFNLEGIVRHQTIKSTPQQNGLTERFNRTILERIRCMLTTTKLFKVFQAEEVKTACYLINLCPLVALGFKTPQQVWSGHASSYEGLKIFGSCAAYAHVKQDKLEPQALKTIYYGVLSQTIKSY